MDEPPPLRFGPYPAPACRVGDSVPCALRGAAVIVGWSSGPFPWPVGLSGGHRGLVLCAGLVEAVRREEARAVAHWWGVSAPTVAKWRKVLGVGRHRTPPLRARPWTPAEDDLVRTLRAPEAAARTGRTLRAVYDRRRHLGLARAGRS